jgi:hypothetical protein
MVLGRVLMMERAFSELGWIGERTRDGAKRRAEEHLAKHCTWRGGIKDAKLAVCFVNGNHVNALFTAEDYLIRQALVRNRLSTDATLI